MKLNFLKRISSGAIGVVLLTTLFAGTAFASDGATVAYNATQNITAHSVCRRVTNGSATGLSLYIPTTTAEEWTSFYDNPPSGVTIASCGCTTPWGTTVNEGGSVTAYQSSAAHTCVSQTRTCTNGTLSGSYQYESCTDTCAGTSVGGYCWYYGGLGQSCNTVCSARGGCNLTGTRNYAGSSGTLANCDRVLDALIGAGSTTDYPYAATGIGCYVDFYGMLGPARSRATNPNFPTTCAATGNIGNTGRRACSCNQ